MNSKNTNKLFRDFPKLYKGHKKPITESLMGFGFECNNGWFQIIYDLSAQITAYAKEKNLRPAVTQVKEKFGSLRYYVDGADNNILQMIDDAERRSAQTCEDCGAPAKLQNRRGWFATHCELCAFQKGYEEAPVEQEEEPEPTSVFGEQVKCVKCGWVHFINISKEYVSHGFRCFRCGIEGRENFVTPSETDIPRGSTIQQVNTVKPK